MADQAVGSGGQRFTPQSEILERQENGKNTKQNVESPFHQKKTWVHFRFKFLLLLSVITFGIYYTLLSSDSRPSWSGFTFTEHYSRLLNMTRGIRRPPYRIHLEHKAKLNETHQPAAFQYHQAYARNYRFIVDHKGACATASPFLVLMVPVAPHNSAARDAIRKTWGKESVVQGERVLTLFVLGLPGGANVDEQQEKVRQEDLLYEDLIQSDFIDSYLNLTIKTMVIMDWLAVNCGTAAYSMKIDSDMFLNIDNLVIMLRQPGIPKTNYLTGMLMWNRPVVRSTNSKWYVPRELYPNDTYPTYTLGMGYVFSSDLPQKYVEISKTIKPFNIEDAYVGMCMKLLGLQPTSPPHPWQFKAYNSKYDRCEFSKVITYILWSPEQLVRYWTDLKRPGAPC